jgi:hypothetical protein
MRASRSLAAALAAVALALPLAGCPSLGGGTASHELSSAQFDDIPVPHGFAIDLSEGHSYSYSEGGGGPASVRMGRIEYTGRGDADEQIQWYAAEMPRPIHGWGPGTAVEGKAAMMFLKGTERCLVSVKTEGAALRIVVERNSGGASQQ